MPARRLTGLLVAVAASFALFAAVKLFARLLSISIEDELRTGESVAAGVLVEGTTTPGPEPTSFEVQDLRGYADADYNLFGCATLTGRLMRLLPERRDPSTCWERAARGENVVLESMVRFSAEWDAADRGRRRFFCDVVNQFPEQDMKWFQSTLLPRLVQAAAPLHHHVDIVSVNKSMPFSWDWLLDHRVGADRVRPLIINFERGRNYCHLLDFGAMARVKFPFIVVGPFGDFENFASFSGNKYNSYFNRSWHGAAVGTLSIAQNFNFLCNQVGVRNAWSKAVELLEDDRLLMWVTYAPDLDHPKIVGVPPGIARHYWRVASEALPQTLLTRKTHLIGVTFTRDLYISRVEWYNALEAIRPTLERVVGNNYSAILYSKTFPDVIKFNISHWKEALVTFQKSKIIVAPGGLGIETKRPVEGLLAGAVILHQRNALVKHYRGLPVIFVDDSLILNATHYSYLSHACMAKPKWEKITWNGIAQFIVDVLHRRATLVDW